MAKVKIINTEIDGSVIRMTVNGVDAPLTIDASTLSDDIRNAAVMHGLVQKVSDAAALGAGASASDKHAAMSAVIARLIEGEWNKRSGDGGGSVAGIIFRAYREFMLAAAKKRKKNISDDDIRALYERKNRSEQLALRRVPEIAEIIDRIKSESGAVSNVDASGLLDELEGL